MLNRKDIIKVVLGVATIGLVVYFYLNQEETVEYNWEVHYRQDSQDPYGTYIFHQLLKQGRSDEFEVINTPISQTLSDQDIENTSYLFIGKSWYYSDDDFVALADYVSRGNDAYILCKEAPYSILNDIGESSLIYFGSERGRKKEMRTGSSSITLDYVTDWKNRAYNWAYADSVASEGIVVLGRMMESKFNFFQVNYGEGSFYFHLTPIAFANFNLRNERTLDYANEVFSQMDEGTLYWDAFSQLPYSEEEVAQSPLVFILNTESLRWAWYLVLFSAICYLLFYTRRRQRPIPVIAAPENTSLSFVKTIAAMYFSQRSNKRIIHHQFNAFNVFIRTRYGFSFQSTDESNIKKLSLKTSIDESALKNLINQANNLQSKAEVANEELISFNRLVESFYKNCR